MEGNATDASHREADDARTKIHGESQVTTIILRIQGCSGPSGIDASGWRRMWTSFSKASSDLCNNIVIMARRICTEYVDPEVLSSTACKLIALDKNPGVHPIGVREVVKRIIVKAVLGLLKEDVQQGTYSYVQDRNVGVRSQSTP